jgi:hypothetical protein
LVPEKPSRFFRTGIQPGFSKFAETEVWKKFKEQKAEAQLREKVD